MEEKSGNYEVFRDCVSATVLANSTKRDVKQSKKRTSRGLPGPAIVLEMESSPSPVAEENDPAELAEFIEVVSEILNSMEIGV